MAPTYSVRGRAGHRPEARGTIPSFAACGGLEVSEGDEITPPSTPHNGRYRAIIGIYRGGAKPKCLMRCCSSARTESGSSPSS
ncbi:MAG: hypothetical protein QOF51_4231 [Chloroflexota bacterium]|jgi:hypothetical protein|nr:hypothetical protein [Chloroflexota bacterium]